MKIKFNHGLFHKLLFFFGGSHVVAILASRSLLKSVVLRTEIIQPTMDIFANTNSWSILLWLLISGLLLYAMIRFERFGGGFYKLFFTLLIFIGIESIFLAFNMGIAVILALVLTIIYWQQKNIFFRNILVALSLAGLALTIGLAFTPTSIVIILILFAFYDVVAVYVTGHMVKMANVMIRARAIFGFVIPTKQSFFRLSSEEIRPGDNVMILGSGDVLLPMMLAVSMTPFSIEKGFIIAIFNLFGLLLMQLLFENQKVRRPMAALPPIVLFSILGYLVVTLF